MLGPKKLAENYEVKITIPRNGDRPAGIWLKTNVFSTDVEKTDLFEDHEGVLEFNDNMANMFGNVDDDSYVIDIGYQILRK